MFLFSHEVYKLITSALNELKASQASARTPHNPLSEAHFLGAWVTTAIKQKRFDSVVLETLKGWQSQARSLGKNAGLKEQFTYLEKCYSQILDTDQQLQPVTKEQFNKLYAALNELQWMVTTDLKVGDKLNRHSGGKDSLVVCAEKTADSFNKQNILIAPLSLYVRGNQQLIIDLAFKQNLLLYKKTDYKSKVKYHGEFIVYPNNNGNSLPELPVAQSK